MDKIIGSHNNENDNSMFADDIIHNVPIALINYRQHSDGTNATTYLSDWCLELWELSEEQVNKDPNFLWDQIHPNDVRTMKEKVHRSAEDLTLFDNEYRIITPSGKHKWVHGIGMPRRMEDGSTFWNITIIETTTEHDVKDMLNRKTKELKASFKGMVQIVSKAVELRDPYTSGHQVRVAAISTEIGKKLGLSNRILEGLTLGALVHDVGKLSIPIQILTKPVKLSEGEMAIIQEHPRLGMDLFAGAHLPWPIREIIGQHHERLDGSGYPEGLKDQDIILEAKIVAVADAFEAMSSDRPYRKSPGIVKAMKELNDFSGIKYHTESVEALNELLKQGVIL